MEQFKRAEVIMLPTKEKSVMLMVYTDVEKTNGKLVFNGIVNDNYKEYQHLYIISDDKIKEGDYVQMDDRYGKVISIIHKEYMVLALDNSGSERTYRKEELKKIIATTDTALKIPLENYYGLGNVNHLPQPSQQFITKYIESYNKGEVITDVLVEYEDLLLRNDKTNLVENKQVLKVNPKNNTITIKKLKDSWNREELISYMWEAYRQADSIFTNTEALREEFDKWITKIL